MRQTSDQLVNTRSLAAEIQVIRQELQKKEMILRGLVSDVGMLRVKPDPAPAASVGTIMATFDGGSSVVAAGSKCRIQIDFACTIVSAVMLADQAGSAVVDVWKDTLANFPPTALDSITASAPMTLTAQQSSEDTTLTGWGTSINAGDVLIFNVDSCSTITQLVAKLEVLK